VDGKKKYRGPTWGRFRFADAPVEEELFAQTEIDLASFRQYHPYYTVQGPKRLLDENRILGKKPISYFPSSPHLPHLKFKRLSIPFSSFDPNLGITKSRWVKNDLAFKLSMIDKIYSEAQKKRLRHYIRRCKGACVHWLSSRDTSPLGHSYVT
jgi:hypothetical protein